MIDDSPSGTSSDHVIEIAYAQTVIILSTLKAELG